MAERPIFIQRSEGLELVKEISLQITWSPGFAPIQKKKNIRALHEAAASAGYKPLLEVSTKSDEKVGQHLSAFHLKVHSSHFGDIALECAFQGSKVFEQGGPFTDIYTADVREAKRDHRLQNSGRLVGFRFDDYTFPLEPKTAFYDWLYINAIFPHREWLTRLSNYVGFTDIEFNPARSVNCQARSCALFMSLMKRTMLKDTIRSPNAFVALLSEHSYRPHPKPHDSQRDLFTSRPQ
jgi:hypothetical protein